MKRAVGIAALCFTLAFVVILMPGAKSNALADESKEGPIAGLYDSTGKLLVSQETLQETYGVSFEYYDTMSDESVRLSQVLREEGWSGTYVVAEGTEVVGEFVFWDCDMLEEVVLPDSVKEIAGGAFAYCSGLVKMELPEKLERIGKGAFYDCAGLTEVVLPVGLREIGDLAFDGCTGIRTVVIPEKVTSIGAGAFFGIPEVMLGETNVAVPAMPMQEALRGDVLKKDREWLQDRILGLP